MEERYAQKMLQIVIYSGLLILMFLLLFIFLKPELNQRSKMVAKNHQKTATTAATTLYKGTLVENATHAVCTEIIPENLSGGKSRTVSDATLKETATLLTPSILGEKETLENWNQVKCEIAYWDSKDNMVGEVLILSDQSVCFCKNVFKPNTTVYNITDPKVTHTMTTLASILLAE